jgi:glutamine amidotransferase
VIAIVDYRAGNVTSVKRAVEHLGHQCTVTADPALVERAERIIVPGVGHFGATTAFSATDLGAALARQIARGTYLLGICLGMQWLFETSDEAPEVLGLGAFGGRCRPFPTAVKSPHVGWDQLEIGATSRLLRGLSSGVFVYFTHAYCAPLAPETVARCSYGAPHTAAVERDNLFGVQFHPEKSAEVGLAVLQNFCTC